MATASAKSPLPVAVPLAHWMSEVLKQREAAREELAAGPIHDLRVALRRCLAIADGFLEIDPYPGWRALHKQAKRLFKRLGALRDIQVLAEWTSKAGPPSTSARNALLAFLESREAEERQQVEAALGDFNRKRWKSLSTVLPERARKLSLNGPAVAHLTLERWNEAHHLHRQAMRNGSHAAFHRLRIGLKRFRYTAENFMPTVHQRWSGDLKTLQDALGEVHDLDLLWQTAIQRKELSAPALRAEWKPGLDRLCRERLDSYRSRMRGRKSLWREWRAALPDGEQVAAAGIAWLEAWASFRTPDLVHARHVAGLALALYDGLARENLGGTENGKARRILHAAALAHDVGRFDGAKSHHKASYRMIAGFGPMLGWTREEIRLAALVARYHRRALPQLKHAAFARLSRGNRQKVLLLAGILRLANAFDQQHDRAVRGLSVDVTSDRIGVRVEGYLGQEPLASRIALARHLLEIACKRPVAVLGQEPEATRPPDPRQVSHAA